MGNGETILALKPNGRVIQIAGSTGPEKGDWLPQKLKTKFYTC